MKIDLRKKRRDRLKIKAGKARKMFRVPPLSGAPLPDDEPQPQSEFEYRFGQAVLDQESKDFLRDAAVEMVVEMVVEDVADRIEEVESAQYLKPVKIEDLGGELVHDYPITGDEEYQFSMPAGMHITDRP